MIVTSALGDLGIERRAELMLNGRRGERMLEARIGYRQAAAKRKAAEITRRAALTPELRAAEDAARAAEITARQAQAASAARFKAELWRGQPRTRNFAVTPLSPEGKEFQAATLARDWDRLFGLTTGGVAAWVPKRGQHAPSLGKYSFRIVNGRRKYIPFTEAEIKSFAFSRHYRTKPGFECTPERRQLGVDWHWGKTRGHLKKYRDTSHPWHIWPILPGWGIRRGDTYQCRKPKKSLWVKLRTKVYVAAAVVAAVYLGPAVFSKVGGMLAKGEAGGAIVGAGAKAGAAAKVGVAAKAGLVAKAGAAAKTAGFFATVQKGVGLVNNARTVNAIIHGDLPPPPIATGENFTEMAMSIAKDELAKDQAEKLTALEEQRMRLELEAIQREIDAFVPRGTPIAPDPNLQPGVRDRIIEIQNIERGRDNTGAIALALAVPVALLAFAG